MSLTAFAGRLVGVFVLAVLVASVEARSVAATETRFEISFPFDGTCAADYGQALPAHQPDECAGSAVARDVGQFAGDHREGCP